MRARILIIVGLLGLALFAQAAAARDPWDGQRAYGYELMTRAEVRAYNRKLMALETHEEKLALWLNQIERMQARALEWGVQLADPPRYRAPGEKPKVRDKAPYFIDIMTDEEVAEYYAALSELEDVDERRAFYADHIMRMRARGFARGVSSPSTHDWDFAFENGERPPDEIP